MTLDEHQIAAVFPRLSKTALDELAADIKANGLLDPVVLFEGKILDGRNRYAACLQVEVTPSLMEFAGDWDAALRFVASKNLKRRDLTNTERAFAAAALAKLSKGRPKNVAPATFSQSQAADLVGTSRDSVLRARQVEERGVPELVEAAKSNEVGLENAAKIAKLPKEEQKKAVAGGRKAMAAAAKKVPSKKAVSPPAAKNVPPPVYIGLSEAEQTIRRGAAGVTALHDLLEILEDVEKLAQSLASGSASIPTAYSDVLGKAVSRIKSGLDWIVTITTGAGFSDEALGSWLSKGES